MLNRDPGRNAIHRDPGGAAINRKPGGAVTHRDPKKLNGNQSVPARMASMITLTPA